ncbi:ATP-binding protein [Streptomyces parvulus]|nr:ATP-binding protein [Streptomyces parvulus]
MKNSYDADASYVLIKLDDTAGPDAPSIIVLDDGVGMSMDAISRTWLEPATPNRRRSRKSPVGRRVLGEKGVGRFATAKLGQLLTIVSRQQDSADEVELSLDWRDFHDEDAYLDEIHILTGSRSARFFSPQGEGPLLWNKSLRYAGRPETSELNTVGPRSEQGTLVKITGLHSRWSVENVKEAQRSLSRLISPFADQKWRETASDFQIILDLPERLAEFSGPVGPPAELGSPHYRLEAKVNNSGHAEIEIWLRGKEGSTKFDTQLPSNGTSCGPFDFYLKVWERDRPSLTESGGGAATYREIREALDAASGISVYRDGFRVLPYGEPGNDWLGLDRRRINSPTRRLSNSQVIGQLLIDRDSNPALIDQTNREGLVSGPALSDLQSKVRQLITELETRRNLLRVDKKPKDPIGRLFERRELSELKEAVAARSDDSLLRLVEDAEEKIEARDTEIREVLARYQRLATLGQLIDQVVHEVGQPVSACRKAALAGIEIIEDWFNPPFGNPRPSHDETLERARTKFEKIRQQAGTINEVLNRFTPFGGRKRGRPHTIVLERAIREAVSILDGEIKKSKVQISLPESETSVTVDNTEIQEVVINLLSNSIYWVSRLPAGSPRKIDLTLHRPTGSELSLIVSDSGPGVPSEIRDQIFDPYFSNRDGGMGLGLTIAGEIVSDYYGGELVLEPAGPLGGATFRATLRRRVGE